MFKKIIVIFRDFSKQLSRDNVAAFASSTAFFFFLSLVPMLMIICSVLPYTPLTEDNLMTAVTRITPDSMDPLMVSMISQVYDRYSNCTASGSYYYDLVSGKRNACPYERA